MNNRKLRPQDVAKIKELRNTMTMKSVGRLFGVSSTTIFRIEHNATYVKEPLERFTLLEPPKFPLQVKTKRVYELVRGDTFVLYNTEFEVTKIKEGRIYYKPLWFSGTTTQNSFGARNQMKVEIIKQLNPQ